MTVFENNHPALWRIGKKDIQDGIYFAVTDAPVPIRFNISISDLLPWVFRIQRSGHQPLEAVGIG